MTISQSGLAIPFKTERERRIEQAHKCIEKSDIFFKAKKFGFAAALLHEAARLLDGLERSKAPCNI